MQAKLETTQIQNLSRGVLLVNLGTPKSFKWKDVYNYLLEFLLDPLVIDLPFLQRNLLVRGVIVPFRTSASAKVYRSVWTPEGSPLLVHSEELLEKVREKFGERLVVELAMRYQFPSIEDGLKKLVKAGVNDILVVPLFPQYASATTGSIKAKVQQVTDKWQVKPNIRFIEHFYKNPDMVEAFAANGAKHNLASFDHILFSFHGLPERHIRKADTHGCCLQEGCCDAIHDKNQNCYKAQCYATAHAIAEKLKLTSENFTVCFQSRLGKDPWIQPYTSETIKRLVTNGNKRLLVFCPAFVADCHQTVTKMTIYGENRKLPVFSVHRSALIENHMYSIICSILQIRREV